MPELQPHALPNQAKLLCPWLATLLPGALAVDALTLLLQVTTMAMLLLLLAVAIDQSVLRPVQGQQKG